MRISIAMCTHNGARYLPEQLASLAAQSRLPDEVVIGDDCSVDETSSILAEFVARAPFPVRLIHHKTQLGSTKNFEQVIALCQGDVIALCDQDDVWLPEKLELFEERFENQPDLGLVFCDAELVDQNGQMLEQRLWDVLKFDAALKAKIRSPLAYEIFDRRELVTGMTMAFRAKFKDLVLPISDNTTLIHDGWIAILVAHTANLDFIDQPLVKYRQHSSQQIGASELETEPQLSVTSVVESVRRQTDFDQEISRVESVRQRLGVYQDRFEIRGYKNLEEILAHFKVRVAASRNKVASIPSLFSELLNGRYHRYSRGFSSLLKDLLR